MSLAVAMSVTAILAYNVLLVLFGAVLVAVLLNGLRGVAEGRLHLSPKWSLAVVLLILIALVGGVGWLCVNRLAAEGEQLGRQLPQAVQSFRSMAESQPWSRDLLARLPDASSIGSHTNSILVRVTAVLSAGADVAANGFVVVVVGLFLAAQPKLYTEGMLRLLPRERRERGREVIGELGETLRSWIGAQLFCMAAVGVLTVIGLLLLGVKVALVLAVIAGLLDFIPTLGPLAAAVPAVLVALLNSPGEALLVAGLYLMVQAIENYVLQPFAQRKAVNLPPALTLSAQLLLGVVLGFGGLVLATPLTVTAMTLVKTLYIEDVLGDREN